MISARFRQSRRWAMSATRVFTSQSLESLSNPMPRDISHIATKDSPFNRSQMDSIWDGPAVPASAPLSRDLEDDGHHALRTSVSEPLFLEDNDIPAPRHREHSEHDNDDMDDLFAGFDNITPLTEPLNVDALMQKARARLDAEKRASNASGAINEQYEELEKNRGGSKSKEGKGKDDLDQKSRRVIAKVDDERWDTVSPITFRAFTIAPYSVS